uniref:Pectate lyase superfamily protein domain-containing protein n=1 Tax=Araucaria cunninghamii TaxID=56994 RepID=A0A0D6RB03_ARACU
MDEDSETMIRLQHHKSLRRWVSGGAKSWSYRTWLVAVWAVTFVFVFLWQSNAGGAGNIRFFRYFKPKPIPRLRPHVFNLTDFGAVGDGVTLNTKAFEDAVAKIASLGNEGGQLNVQAGTWLTAPFNLTSHMTLFLAEEAVILGVEDEKYWPLMPALPSYGYGREHPGPRYGSLIHGQHLQDVVITGYNGTIDGQGQSWWTKYRQKQMNHTRGRLVQFMWSSDIQITNITLRNSPFWTLHPYDCKNVLISGLTILAPLEAAPNTDGIDPDSCQNVIIENCYISVGDDCIAIKSGWDQYGIAYGRPSANLIIRNLILRSRVSAAVSIGSEMSGGVSNVTVENILVWQSRRGVRIKTSPGRGGYVRDIYYRNLKFDTLRVGIVIKTDYGEHPDDKYDPKALPKVENIFYHGVYGTEVRVPVRIYGSAEIPIRNVEFRDMEVGVTYKKKHIFQCTYLQGKAIGNILPRPCENLALYDEYGRLVRPAKALNESNIDYDF